MNIPDEAMAAAKEAMREVTPPPGVSKADWLAEHGSFALIAGAIAAAAPYIKAQALREAADRIIGPSDVPLDGATCHWNAMDLRDRARKIQEGGRVNIPDEAIESAAEALVSSTLGDRAGIKWEEFFEAARKALNAAAPHLNPTNKRNAMPEVSDNFIAARLTDSGATIEQITGGRLIATIKLEPGQIQFVIDQLSGAK